MDNEHKIISLIFKDFLAFYNSRNISKEIGISHVGAFKILKKLEKREIVKSRKIGKAIIYSLNAENPVTFREIEMALTLEAQNYQRWVEEFKDLREKIIFAILFGSITRNEKEAKDIDLLVVAEKNKFSEIRKIINERNKFLSKKVHLILQTSRDFENDVKNGNKAMIEIIKTGIVLFGQEQISKILIK